MNGGVLDQITQAFQTATQGWQSGLYTVALDLFGILALIDLVAALILLVVQGGKPDFSDLVFTIIRWLIPVGLFLWIMQNAPTFSADIVDSLRQAATAAGGSAITPSAVLTAGVNAAAAIWAQMHNTWNPATLVALMVCDLLICVAFCLAAVWMCAALVEAYFVIGASALFVAFGAMRWSREIAVSLLRFCLAIGMKLFAISMIVAIGSQFIQQWTEVAANLNIQGLFTIVGCSIALAALAKIVPDTMQRVVLAAPMSLAHHSQWRSEVAGAAAIAAAPALAAIGGTALAVQAARYGVENLSETNRDDEGRIARAMQMTRAMGGGLTKAAGAEIGARLGGRMRGGATASMVRMAQNISQQRRVNTAERSRPQPPNNPGNSAGSNP